jgi:DNA-binding MarR family transcriptional regulator
MYMEKTTWAPQMVPTFWINHASRLIMRQFEDELRPLGFGFAYVPVVRALEESGPLIQKDLVALAHVEQPTMTALLARMERDHIIRRVADPADGRANRISLTAEAKKKLPRVRAALQVVVERALAGLEPDGQQALMDLLQRVVQNLNQRSKTGPSDARLK